MKKEDLQAALEAISKSGIQVAGDLVLEKNVEYEGANVEEGGIGIQIVNGSYLPIPDTAGKAHAVHTKHLAVMSHDGLQLRAHLSQHLVSE